MNKKLGLLLVFSLVAMLGSASAFTEANWNPCKNATKTVTITGVQRSIYADFTFSSASHADFNNYVLNISGSTPALTLEDLNFSAGTTFSVGTLGDSDSATATVYRIDGNAEGLCYVSAVAQVSHGTTTDAGVFTVYQILLALGSVVGLVILGVVITLFFKKINWSLKFGP